MNAGFMKDYQTFVLINNFLPSEMYKRTDDLSHTSKQRYLCMCSVFMHNLDLLALLFYVAWKLVVMTYDTAHF